jgi:hypothetical protein
MHPEAGVGIDLSGRARAPAREEESEDTGDRQATTTMNRARAARDWIVRASGSTWRGGKRNGLAWRAGSGDYSLEGGGGSSGRAGIRLWAEAGVGFETSISSASSRRPVGHVEPEE